MTGAAIALVLVSALLHATWNLFNKGSRDRWAFFLGQGVVMCVVYGPALLWRWPQHGIAPAAWLWIGLSAVTHVAYAVFLLKAYDAGDLSVAYPLSRTAPVLVALWDMTMTRGQLTAGGIGGTMLSGIGALLLQLPAIRAHGARAVARQRVTRYALITAVFIAAFTIIDKQGVQHLSPFVYLYLFSAGECTLMAIRLGRGAVKRVGAELRSNARAVIFTGVVGAFSYLLILWALTASPASYVLGLRQCSIVFGVLLGHFFLNEQDARYRLLGASVIATGSTLIAAFG